MECEDLTFSIKNNNGDTVECNILSIVPIDNSEAYVIFIDGEKDDNLNYIFIYGKLVKNDEDYELKAGVSELELNYIQENFYNEILELSKKIIESRG